jgi:hypothetical protein
MSNWGNGVGMKPYKSCRIHDEYTQLWLQQHKEYLRPTFKTRLAKHKNRSLKRAGRKPYGPQ